MTQVSEDGDLGEYMAVLAKPFLREQRVAITRFISFRVVYMWYIDVILFFWGTQHCAPVFIPMEKNALKKGFCGLKKETDWITFFFLFKKSSEFYCIWNSEADFKVILNLN